MSIEAPIQGIPKGHGYFITNVTANETANTARYNPLGFVSGTTYTATESLARIQVDFSFRINSIRVNNGTNTRNGNITVAFRDDGASVGAVTVTSNTPGTYATTGINTIVDSGSLCNFIIDLSAGSSGNFGSTTIIVDYDVV